MGGSWWSAGPKRRPFPCASSQFMRATQKTTRHQWGAGGGGVNGCFLPYWFQNTRRLQREHHHSTVSISPRPHWDDHCRVCFPPYTIRTDPMSDVLLLFIHPSIHPSITRPQASRPNQTRLPIAQSNQVPKGSRNKLCFDPRKLLLFVNLSKSPGPEPF
jgi:hypothetical protein